MIIVKIKDSKKIYKDEKLKIRGVKIYVQK